MSLSKRSNIFPSLTLPLKLLAAIGGEMHARSILRLAKWKRRRREVDARRERVAREKQERASMASLAGPSSRGRDFGPACHPDFLFLFFFSGRVVATKGI